MVVDSNLLDGKILVDMIKPVSISAHQATCDSVVDIEFSPVQIQLTTANTVTEHLDSQYFQASNSRGRKQESLQIEHSVDDLENSLLLLNEENEADHLLGNDDEMLTEFEQNMIDCGLE